MARIFVSYSRVDKSVTEVLVDRLRRIYGHDDVWYDDSLHGGDIWWEKILDQIAACDIFIYLLSNESVNSLYCQAEFEEAQRLQKRIITVQVRDKTELTPELGDIQYVDMKAGPDDADALARLAGSIYEQMKKVRKHRPQWRGRTPHPGKIDPEPESIDRQEVTTPELRPPEVNRPSGWRLQDSWATIIAAFVTGIFGVIAVLVATRDGTPLNLLAAAETVVSTRETATAFHDQGTATATQATAYAMATETQSAAQTATAFLWTDTPTPNLDASVTAILTEWAVGTATQQSLDQTATATLWTMTPTGTPTDPPTGTNAVVPTLTRTPTPTRTSTPTLTNTPDVAVAARTVIAEQTVQAIAYAETATATQATANAVEAETQSAAQTATATLWTATPTPNYTATVAALLTEWAVGTATQQSLNQTATATLWTMTPTPTPVINNLWTPVVQEFDGVEMVLVPAGCFTMGSTAEEIATLAATYPNAAGNYADQGPQTDICFDEAFWIDRYEVTNSEYKRCVDDGDCTPPRRSSSCYQYGDPAFDNHPVVCVNWFQANQYAQWSTEFRLPTEGQWREAEFKLPTEAQWEYAARGPDGLIYPWGSEFQNDNVVYNGNSYGTAQIGSRPDGVSWVGAYDLSGNVWEWTSSIKLPYPYDADDGREDDTDTGSGRVLRGGSWHYGSDVAQAVYRNRYSPGSSFSDYGFRLVLLPSSPDE